MERRSLSNHEINSALGRLAGWEIVHGKLHKEFRFRDFNEAFGFMTRIALVAENLGHHPEWSNVYGTVTVDLMTHDAGGITDYDLILAGKMDVYAFPSKRPVEPIS